jgi:hypothetical protein
VLLVVGALTEPDPTLKVVAIAAAGITVAVIVVQVIDRRTQRPKFRWAPAERRRAGVVSAWAVLGSIAAVGLWIVLSRPGLAAALTVLLFAPFIVFVFALYLYAVFKGRVRAAKTR